ncbi:hypothetical protein [Streptomyces sp. AC512_CC834]|uniref:hypothetical protein n=1 Tax=Streptomyces sp. AC512_CC834 TaxID=2823691 RepID=UPI001C25A798|nr:hypothetical protein [Streptomyces sp. AC512_CC834]
MTTTTHRRIQWRRDPAGAAYRTMRSFPAGPANATVLLAGPGSVAAVDGDGRDDRLLDALTRSLVAGGAQVLQCDMPVRAPGTPSTAADQRARADRISQLLYAHGHLMRGPLALIGFSLGGQALLRLLESGTPRRAARVVLVGTVVEEDAFLTSRLTSLDLVYGSLDLVGYVTDADGSLPPAVFDPGVYGDWSAGRVIGRRSIEVGVHVLEGLGHTLQPCGPDSVARADPVPALTTLVGGGPG